jgi:uncharacterized membrane protein
VGLIAILSPGYILAQGVKTGLDLRLVSGGYNDEVNPGEDNIFFMEIANNSTDTITNIGFSADSPKGWVVEFTPETIDFINADNYQTVDVNIKPPQNTSKGRYTVTVIADSVETRRVMSIFVRVENGISVWAWVGAIVAAVVITGFVIIFRRFGREQI